MSAKTVLLTCLLALPPALGPDSGHAEPPRSALPPSCVPHIAGLVPPDKVDCPPTRPSTPRLSLCTFNFTAITPQAEPEHYAAQYPYIANLPGLIIDKRMRDYCGKGQVIPAFATREAGVAAWWTWLRTRTNRRGGGDWGYKETDSVSLAMLSEDICGCAAKPGQALPASLRNYRAGYAKYARQFFGREVDMDEKHRLADLDALWAIARTMYSHEAGRPIGPEHLTRDQFLMGVALGEYHVNGRKVDITDFIAE